MSPKVASSHKGSRLVSAKVWTTPKTKHLVTKGICGSYPIHTPTRLAINRKKRVDFRVLKNPSPVRNGFFLSLHLLFIFIYYDKNQVRTKYPSLTPVRKKSGHRKLDFWVRGLGYLLGRYLMRGSTPLSLELGLY